MSRYPSDRKVYVGDLGSNARKNELEYAFGSYGTLRSVWIARNPPGFAFVEFEDARDAADAVRGLDGRTVCGRRARVELSSGKFAASNRSERRTDRSRPGRSFSSDDKCYECGGRGHYARDCRRYGRNKRSHSRSRSRSHSRGHRFQSRTRSRSRSRSDASLKEARKSRETTTKSRQNGRKEENGDSSRYSDEHNGSGASQSPKRRYNDSTPSPGCSPVTKRFRRSSSRRRDDGGGASPSRSRSNSHRE